MEREDFRKFIFSGAIIFLLFPLFVFSQDVSITLKEKQVIDILDIIRKVPLSKAQSDLFYESIYWPNSDNAAKAGAIALTKQIILQDQLDYWLVKMPVEFSKRFIKAVYKILPAVAYGDFSGAIDLIEKYTVEQANNYVNNWLKQNQTQIGSGIGKYDFWSFKNSWQEISVPYIIVYSPISANQAKVVVEFYSKKFVEPPIGTGINNLGSSQDNPRTNCWPWDIWLQSSYNKSSKTPNKIEPFIVRVKGQIVKDKYGNFAWDKTAETPSVEVEFGKPVPEIDQSDIILADLQTNQSQGFLKDKINQIKQTAQGIVDQIKQFFAVFKPQAQISDFLSNNDFPTSEVGKFPHFGGGEDGWDEGFDDIAQQSQEIVALADEAFTQDEVDTIREDLLKLKAELEQAIKEKQAELDKILSDSLLTESEDLEDPLLENSLVEEQEATTCSRISGQEPSFDKVIFNEIAWMGTKISASDEWIELKNISVYPVDLNGWQIFNKSQNLKIIFTTTTIVAPKSLFLLERTNDDSAPKVKADYIYTGALANTDEMLYLVGLGCILQDRIQAIPYWQEGDNITKETMERNQFFGWQTSSVVGGTPKVANSVGKIKPLSSAAGGSSKAVEVKLQQPEATTTAPATSTDPVQATSTIEATSTSSALAQVLIVEIQIETASSTSDDFVKIFNQSTTSPVNITNWQLKKRNSNGNEDSIKKFTGNDYIIEPQSYFLWMNSAYELTTTTKPNATTTQKISENNSIALFNINDEIVDQVAWGSSTNPFVEGAAFLENPNESQNLLRKFFASSSQYQDTGDNSQDFELATTSIDLAISTSTQAATTTQPEELPAIVNLMAIPSTNREAVDLLWTCPTSATAYIIKKSEQEIFTTAWDTAETIAQNIIPKLAGEVESFSVDNLPSNRKTYFAIKYILTSSEQATSSISNIASATAWPNFQDNNDGTLTDLRTGLGWLKDASSSVNNFGASSTQDNAVSFITGQNSEWRLPNFKELATLFNYSFPTPGVGSLFLNVKPERYWSISKRMINSPGWGTPPRYSGWAFNFANGQLGGSIYDSGEDSALYSFIATKNKGIPGGLAGDDDFDFTDNFDGTIKDNRTGLMWLNSSLAQTIDKRRNWNNAFLFASNAVLCNDGTLQGNENKPGDCSANGGVKYDDWRLPNIQELMEITKLDNQPGTPSILPSLSFNVSFYWTSALFDQNNAWYVGDGFCFGTISYMSRTVEALDVQLLREE